MYTLHLLIGTRSVTQGCADKGKVGHIPTTLLLCILILLTLSNTTWCLSQSWWLKQLLKAVLIKANWATSQLDNNIFTMANFPFHHNSATKMAVLEVVHFCPENAFKFILANWALIGSKLSIFKCTSADETSATQMFASSSSLWSVSHLNLALA